MKIFSFILILFTCIFVYAYENLLIIDYDANSIDQVQRTSFINLFSDEISAYNTFSINVVKDNSVNTYWNNPDKLIENTADYKPYLIVIFKYYALGENFILKVSTFNTKTKSFNRSEEFSLKNPEELRTVAKVVALMITKKKTKKQLEEIGLIVPGEKKEILKKRDQGLQGISFSIGYMWATVNGGYAGDYDKVLLLTGSLPIETSKNTRMDITGDLLVAASLAATIGYTYIVTPTTATPYIGGDIGVEYVFHRLYIPADSSRSLGGIVLRPKIGFIFLNTYKSSMFIETAFRVVTNDFTDSGLEFKFGFIIR